MAIVRTKYDRNYFETAFYREASDSQRNINRLKEILKYKKNGKLLEIGCGKGGFLKLATKHFDIEGMDISEYALNSARKILGDHVYGGNIETASLKSGYYDVIVVFNLLEHLKNPRAVIKKLHKGLKRGGIVIGSVPNNFGLVGKMATSAMNFVDRTHRSVYKPDYWHSAFEEAGFQKIIFFGEVLKNRNSNYYVKNRFWKYISFNLMFLCKKHGKSF